MKLLVPLVLLVLRSHGAPQDPDDYFGQAEAEYDYYYNDDIMEDKNIPDLLKHERLIQEIDARGSNITILDSRVDRIDARGGRLNIHSSDTININGGSEVPSPESLIATTDIPETEPPPVAESLIATTDIPETEPPPVAEALESTTTPVPVTEDLVTAVTEVLVTDVTEDLVTAVTDLENAMIVDDEVDFENNFMDKLQGLNVGMESVVTILKEIAGKVGCANGNVYSSGKMERSTSCPPPFNLVRPNDCLFLSQANKVTWSSARQICNSLGADLLHPRLQGQGMEFVLGINAYTSAPPAETVWVGASDMRKEGIWTWVNGLATPTDLPWSPGHPKSFNGREDCMAMEITHPVGLQASNCMRKKPFICQKEYVKK